MGGLTNLRNHPFFDDDAGSFYHFDGMRLGHFVQQNLAVVGGSGDMPGFDGLERHLRTVGRFREAGYGDARNIYLRVHGPAGGLLGDVGESGTLEAILQIMFGPGGEVFIAAAAELVVAKAGIAAGIDHVGRLETQFIKVSLTGWIDSFGGRLSACRRCRAGAGPSARGDGATCKEQTAKEDDYESFHFLMTFRAGANVGFS